MLVRLLFGFLIAGGLLCFAAAVATRDIRWRQRGVVLIRWTVIAGLAAFAFLILERVVVIL